MTTATELREKAEAIAEEAPLVYTSLAPALVAALADLTVVPTGRKVNAGTYSYDYAALDDIVKMTRPVLKEHGLVALTPIHAQGGELACTVILLHTSGERLDLGPFTFPHGRDAQATGSAVTYHRRYALVAALGMAAGDDDDGAAAKPRQAAPPETVAAPPSPIAIAKNHVLELALGSTDLAKDAWAYIEPLISPDYPVGALDRLFTEFMGPEEEVPE